MYPSDPRKLWQIWFRRPLTLFRTISKEKRTVLKQLFTCAPVFIENFSHTLHEKVSMGQHFQFYAVSWSLLIRHDHVCLFSKIWTHATFIFKATTTLALDKDRGVIRTIVEGWGRTVRQWCLIPLTAEGLVVHRDRSQATGLVQGLWSIPGNRKYHWYGRLIWNFTKKEKKWSKFIPVGKNAQNDIHLSWFQHE